MEKKWNSLREGARWSLEFHLYVERRPDFRKKKRRRTQFGGRDEQTVVGDDNKL